MRKVFAVTAALALLCLGSLAQANVLDLGTGYTSLETVAVGDPGNTGELSGSGAGGYGPNRTCGSVGYNYSIGKYEVTAKQYTEFLNSKATTDTYGLYNISMWSSSYGCKIQRSGTSGSYTYSVALDRANRPVNYVSYWDSLRFANWLSNGQGAGDTETGTYTLGGYNGADGRTILRNTEWTWAVTSEDEWYKAAYYKGGGTNVGYWDYPTSNDAVPGNDLADASGNNANYNRLSASPYYRTEAGEFQNSESAYGTFDQGGNVWEWNEAIVYEGSNYADRGTRGGSFYPNSSNLLASARNWNSPLYEDDFLGFRLSQAPDAEVPEPTSLALAAGGLMTLIGIGRRRRA